MLLHNWACLARVTTLPITNNGFEVKVSDTTEMGWSCILVLSLVHGPGLLSCYLFWCSQVQMRRYPAYSFCTRFVYEE